MLALQFLRVAGHGRDRDKIDVREQDLEIGPVVRDGLVADADPAAIREAATKAKNLGAMLSAEVSGKVSAAIIEARAAAREITKRVEKAGESAAIVVAELQTARIDGARFTFLDLDENRDEIEPQAPAARGIDYEPAPPAQTYAAAAPASLELF